MKIVINNCYGGWGVSPAATLRYNELKGRPCFLFHKPDLRGPYVPFNFNVRPPLGLFYAFDTPTAPPDVDYSKHSVSVDESLRADPMLVQTVEELGQAASGTYAELKVVEIPDGIEWEISEHDGIETIHEKHRSWS